MCQVARLSTHLEKVSGEKERRKVIGQLPFCVSPRPHAPFFHIKYWLVNLSILRSVFFPWLSSFFFLCDVNQLDEWLRDTSICPHTHTHTYTHADTHGVIAYPSHSFLLYILLHHRPVVASRLVSVSFRRHFSFFFSFSKNIPVGSPSRLFNLHLVSAPCWDAPVWFRRWLRAGKWGRLLLSSLDAACHSQDHSFCLSGMRAHRCECLRLSKWNRKWGWFVDARGREE